MSLFETGAANEITLAEILAVEDTPAVLEFTCPTTGLAAWPQVRMWYIRQVMADLLYGEDASPDFSARHPLARTAKVIARSLLHNWRLRHSPAIRAEVIITTEALADQLVDGKWFNRMADPFAELTEGRSLVLVDQHEWQWHHPRHNPNTYLHAPIQASTALVARFNRSDVVARQARDLAGIVRTRARSLLGWDMGEQREIAYATYIARKMAATPARYRAYRDLLSKTGAKLLLNSSGCYGQIATMIAAANDLGVVTAEFQHGAISEGHDAYNYAPATRNSDQFRRTLPTYFLSYGKWWNDRINVPVEKVAIGYPMRERKLAGLSDVSAGRNAVLILGDGVELDQYINLARALRDGLAGSGLQIVFRPHPAERTTALRRFGRSTDGITIDDTFDIYQAFAGAHAVISEVSTGLFEAVGLVERIVMLDTAKARFAYPLHPFTVARSVEDLVKALVGAGAGQPAVSAEDLWEANSPENYRRFVRQKVALA